MGGAKEVAPEFAEAWTWREKLRWLLADKCASVGQLPALADELSNNFGVSVNVQTLKNYARVSRAFTEEHRHLQYKWSNYLAWSKWENPIGAMEQALDCGYSPRQMDNLRKHGDPHYKKPQPELCQVCGGDLLCCHHGTESEVRMGMELERRGFRRSTLHPRHWARKYPDGEQISVDYQDEG